MSFVHALPAVIGIAALIVAAAYSMLTLLAVIVWRLRKFPGAAPVRPPITLLKPLCGAEPGLYEHLRGFCLQDYPEYQVIFGLRDPADPARAVAQRLAEEFPSLPIDIVVNPQQHGNNHKISNLINMLERARHDTLVMADSDAYVGTDYLAIVAAPLLDPQVGLVTCTYRAVPTDQIWSRLGAMYINEWYLPSVLVAWLFGYEGYVSGQTMCLRQATVRAIGGFRAIANHLADDHRVGELIRGLNLRVVLSPYLVNGVHHEQNLASLTRHELRWMRTIHVLRPWSFRMIFLSFSLPLAVLGVSLAAAGGFHSATVWMLFCITAAIRLALHCLHRRTDEPRPFADLWLVPVRDGLLCWVWFRSFFTSRITWRGAEFDVDADGFLRKPT